MRRSLLPIAWIITTVSACALAWSAVGHVADRVTDHTAIVGDSSIRDALRRNPSGATLDAQNPIIDGADASPGLGGPGSPSAAATAGRDGSGADRAPGAGAQATNSSGPSSGLKPTTSTAPPPSSQTPSPSPTPTPTPIAPSPPVPAPAPTSNASVIVIGGSVTASCATGTPNLISAIPANGFGTQVSRGFQLVVDFISATHHSIVEAECDGTRVQWSTGEESAN